MIDTGPFLLLLGVILYIGVISSFLFERYRVPDVLNLIGIGLVLGPLLHLIDPAILTPWMPIIGAIAICLILFEGGLDLDFDLIVTRFGLAFALGAGTFLLCAGGIACAYRAVAGEPWITCALLGSSLGCASSAVILPIAGRLNVSERARATINLEAVFSDLFGVVTTLVLIRFAGTDAFDAGGVVNTAFGAFSTAIVAGGCFGLLWLWALDRLRKSPFAYMMTLAAVFVLYGLTELAHGSGPMAALTFGVFLTNADKIAEIFGRQFKFVLDEKIRSFNTEATFFARTFFFVYLGLVVSLKAFDSSFYAASLGAFFVIVLSRALVIRVVEPWLGEERPDAGMFLAMVPRGLTSAVLASMAWSAEVPGTEHFLDYTFAVILLSNALMTLLVWRKERG